jgi:putative membrane protein insertion efficiency factor
MKAVSALLHLPAKILILLFQLYQRVVSPVLPVVFGANSGCRFAPTCSHYAIGAVREHGAIVGAILALIRLLKCNPLHPGGFDAVPARGNLRCTLVSRHASEPAHSRIG